MLSRRVPVAALVTLGGALALAPHATAAPASSLRPVVVVSNNWDGTADVVDPVARKRLKRLNIIPDKAERLAEIAADPDPKARFYLSSIKTVVGDGHDQYVDDAFTSKDGRLLYVSRPSFKDVIALDVATGKIRWRTRVDGFRSDHMGISPDGRRLLVSASTARVVDVIATASGRIVGRFPSGDTPHENTFSRDGRRIFHASIGTSYSATDTPAEDATKGERLFEIIDARTLKVTKRIDMGAELAKYGITVNAAVRPIAIAPDERSIFFQLSFLHGFVEYDLVAGRPKRIAILPLTQLTRELPRTAYTQDSAHHGLTMNPQGTKLCVAGTMSNYAAIVSRRTLEPQRIIPVGDKPYWSLSSPDGRTCMVSVSGEDRVALISYRTARVVGSIPVGDHPQRMRVGALRRDVLT